MSEPSQVFISYSHDDREMADQIASGLLEAGFAVWMDTSIPAGSDWAAALEREMTESDAFVLLLSPNFLASEWGLYELGFILSENRSRGGKVVPVLVRAAKVSSVLAPFQLIDATREPLSRVLPRIVNALGGAGVVADTRLPGHPQPQP